MLGPFSLSSNWKPRWIRRHVSIPSAVRFSEGVRTAPEPASIVRNGSRFVGPAAALLTGVAAVLLHREPPGLVDPHVCAGVLEWIGAAAARRAGGAAAGAWLLAADRILIVGAVASFVSAAFAASRSWPAAIAAGLAFGVQPLLSPSFTVFAPAVAIATGLLASARRQGVVLVMIAAGALINPPATLPLAALALWWMWRPGTPGGAVSGVAAAMAIAGLVWILQFVLPPMSTIEAGLSGSCRLPVARGPFLPQLWASAQQWLAAPTMFALALAAFGVFSRTARAAPAVLVGFVAAMFVTAPVDPGNVERALLPASVLLWLIVAAGLAELLAGARRVPARAAVLALAALLPALQMPRLAAGTQSLIRPAGHAAIAPSGMHHLIELLPDGSALVVEDALVDLLLRAEGRSWERMGKRVTLVALDESAVTAALRRSSSVLAFPRAQLELQSLGFRLTDRAIGDVSGLADVALVSPCAQVPRGWQAVPTLNASRVVSIVAEGERDRGPFVLYVATRAPPRPVPQEWSKGVSQGYIVSTFQIGQDDTRLGEALQDDGLASADFATARYVVRFEIRRVPGAPRTLSIDLGEPPSVAYAKKWREAAGHRLRLCPAFPRTPVPIVIR